jgi:hypothetical protein
MSYCVYADIQAATGTNLDSSTITALITQADAEIDAYLLPYGVTGSNSGACKSASINLTKGLLCTYQNLDAEAEERYRRAAYKLLQQLIDSQTSLSSSKMIHVRKVN